MRKVPAKEFRQKSETKPETFQPSDLVPPNLYELLSSFQVHSFCLLLLLVYVSRILQSNSMVYAIQYGTLVEGVLREQEFIDAKKEHCVCWSNTSTVTRRIVR